ncbi:MAG: protein kinase, partial [candidate division Zixibacteria bacterium]|nr:protein kinase [candidate division Zixibacteria bacterium]
KKPQGHFKLPSNLNPNLDRKFDNIILKCLAQEPKDRYQTAVELKDAILEATEGEHTSSKTEDFSMSGSSSFLGKCRYLDTIKETRFGSTILVENKLNKKLYIIKKHKKGDTGRKEANLLKSLNHDNILRVFGAGGDRQSTVVITDYAQGGSLVDRMIRNYEWKKAFNIILQVFVGLDFAHKNNIVHGDIRPSNILFDADDVIKLSDFGMPLHYDEKKKKNWYFPPERRQSRQGDIYGVGVILHQMIIGSNPRYDSGNNVILNSLQPKMPEEACQMLSRMLAIRAARRYQSCEEFLLDWDEYDQRRKDKLVKKIVRAESPEPTKNIPLWVYILVGLGIIGLILVVLYFSGQLR